MHVHEIFGRGSWPSDKKNNGLDFGSDLLSNLDPGILFLFAYLQYVK